MIETAEQEKERGLTREELTRFFSVLSHDLKSPIFSIDGFSDLLLADYAGKIDEEGEDFLRRIRSSAQHMKRVLDDMGHIVKLFSRPVSPRRVELHEVIEELRLKYNNLLDEGVTLHVAESLPSVETDPELLKEALGALLKNAGTFTDRAPGERDIWFDVDETSDAVRISVRDNGIGIDPRYVAQVFELGLKLDKSRGNGPGYGLFLARKIAGVLGGELTAESEPGVGSTFTLSLPR